MLEGAAQYGDICDEISKVLDSMYTAELPRELYVKDLIHKEMANRFAPRLEPKLIGPTAIPCQSITDGRGAQEWTKTSYCN